MNPDDWMQQDLRTSIHEAGFQAFDPDGLVQAAGQRTKRRRALAATLAVVAVVGLAGALLLPALFSQSAVVPAVPADSPSTGGSTPATDPTPGGSTSSDPASAIATEWVKTSASGIPEQASGMTIVWVSGKYLVLGGHECQSDEDCSQDPLWLAKSYDPAGDTWADIAEPPVDLSTSTVEPAVIDDTVYLAGDAGAEAGCGHPFFWSYDAGADTWTELPLSENTVTEECALNGWTMYPVGDRIVVLAGLSTNDYPESHSDLVFDLATKKWTVLPPDPSGSVAGAPIVARYAYVEAGNLVVGSLSDGVPGSWTITVLDLQTETWSDPVAVSGLPEQTEAGSAFHCGELLRNGLLVCGDVAEEYSPPQSRRTDPAPSYTYRINASTAQATQAGRITNWGGMAKASGHPDDYEVIHHNLMNSTGETLLIPEFPQADTWDADPEIPATPLACGRAPNSALGYQGNGQFWITHYE
jgi:hypothetical protein